MSNLLLLAAELLHEIGSKLDQRDLCNLRLVCQQINTAVESLALSELVIGPLSLHSFEKLEAYATRSTKAVEYVRQLTLLNWLDSNLSGEQSDVVGHRGRVESVLKRVITGLVNLQAFVLVTRQGYSNSWILEHIAQTPKIQNFTIELSRGFSDLTNFDKISDLRKFSFENLNEGVDDGQAEMAIQHAAKLIAHSPQLNDLKISTYFYAATETAPKLHDFLPNATMPGHSPLVLKHLEVRALRISLDEHTLPHLRSLQSLKIRNNLTTPEKGSDLTTIWNTLRTERICLTYINLNLIDVEGGLLDYLIFNTGIRKLVLDNSGRVWGDVKQMNIMARRFFETVLPEISHSLEILRIITSKLASDGWCLDDSNVSAFAKCHMLKELEISVISRKDSDGVGRNLIKEVTDHLLHLETLVTLEITDGISSNELRPLWHNTDMRSG